MKLGDKFSISCTRENFIDIQHLLFSNGYKWNGDVDIMSKSVFVNINSNVIYLSNYGGGIFNRCVLSNKFVFSVDFDFDKDVNVYTDIQLLRRFKLEKLGSRL